MIKLGIRDDGSWSWFSLNRDYLIAWGTNVRTGHMTEGVTKEHVDLFAPNLSVRLM